ncbi:MAG TPA: hypothetical protein VIF88_09075 [Methylocystis sp.]
MSSAIYSTPDLRATEFKFQLLLGVLFPAFLVATAAQRLLRRARSHEAPVAPTPSVVAEARENMLIVISYALIARAMLQSFARENRAERLS